MEPWVFGEAPLAQTAAAAARLRRATDLLLAAEGDDPAVDALLEALDRFEAAMPANDGPPRVGPVTEGRVYLDHGRDVGAYHPFFPAYDLIVDGPRATGTVTFPIAFEGPAGLVHGGFLALLVDVVVQHHNCEVGVAGKTASLTMRYRRPTPIQIPLTVTCDRRVEDGRIHATVQVLDGDRLLCEGDVEAVAGDRSAMPEVSPRRSAP